MNHFGNILFIGHARHGKDTAAEMFAEELGLTLKSSSLFMAERVIFKALKEWPANRAKFPSIEKFFRNRDTMPDYRTVEECFADRGNYRALWFGIIGDVNTPDPATLGRMIWAQHDIYVGLRSKAEFHALRNSGLISSVIWVDRSDHLPPEPKSSMQLEQWMANNTIDNNGTLDQLRFNVRQLANLYKP